jgi:hypothetical protein
VDVADWEIGHRVLQIWAICIGKSRAVIRSRRVGSGFTRGWTAYELPDGGPPVLHCPALADHHDPVTTNHLPGGKAESAAKTGTARLRRST